MSNESDPPKEGPIACMVTRARARDAARRARERRQKARKTAWRGRAARWAAVAAVSGLVFFTIGWAIGRYYTPGPDPRGDVRARTAPAAPQPQILPPQALAPVPMPVPIAPRASSPPRGEVPGGIQAEGGRPNLTGPPQVLQTPGRGSVVVIIDDLAGGTGSARVVEAMPAGVTLSFLPFGRDLQAQVDAAKADGHEVWLHLPMAPSGGGHAAHPMMLRAGFADEELAAALDAFTGYAGVNNHMGSGLTTDRAAMDRVMAALAARGVPFIDSRTIASSVACDAAAGAGVPCAQRSVFLDHDPDPAAIAAALVRAEALAREQGTAIAIGHTSRATMDALAAWLPTLSDRGLTLVPASALVRPPCAGGRCSPPR